jgi:hypothetical protein
MSRDLKCPYCGNRLDNGSHWLLEKGGGGDEGSRYLEETWRCDDRPRTHFFRREYLVDEQA